MSPEQMRDKKRLEELYGKKKRSRFIRVVADPDMTDPLAPTMEDLAAFPSEFSILRYDEHDNLGYRIPRLVPKSNGEHVTMPEQRGGKPKGKKKKGRKQKMTESYSVLEPGQPDIDAGVDGWIQPKDTQEFVTRGNRMDALLKTFNRVVDQILYEHDEDGSPCRDKKGRKIEARRIPHVKTFQAETSVPKTIVRPDGSKYTDMVKAKASTVSYRDTIGVSPGLSRALQRMVEDGRTSEARMAIESAMEPLARLYEETYRGPATNAKVTSMVAHLDSGHAHFDLWNHTTYVATAKTGLEGEVVPVRFWDAKASCHYGPGPGVTFWMRHFDALGDLVELSKSEPIAARNAGLTRMLCEKAIGGCRKRAEDAHGAALIRKSKIQKQGEEVVGWIRPADDYARDLKMSQAADRILMEAIRNLELEKDYVGIGMAEYKEHLVEGYRSGGIGIRMETSQDLEHVRKLIENSETKAGKEREAAEAALAAVRLEKLELERLRDEVSALQRNIDVDTTAAKASRAAAELAEKTTSIRLAAAEEAARSESESILETARKVEKDVQVLMDEMPAKEDAAKLRGVKAAFAAVFPGREPNAETTEEIVVEIQTEIEEVRTVALAEAATKAAEAELLGVQAAFAAVLPGREPVAKTAAEIVVEIQQGIQASQTVAVAESKLGAVKAAYAAILPGRDPTTENVVEIVSEIQTGIQEVRTDALAEAELRGVKAAFAAVLPGREPAAKTAAEIVLEIQTGIGEVKTAAMGEIVEKQAVLDVREMKFGELTRKANLWDKAEELIKRVFDLFLDPEQQKIKEFASGDSGKLPTAKVTSWKQAFSRLAVMAGIVKGKEPEI